MEPVPDLSYTRAGPRRPRKPPPARPGVWLVVLVALSIVSVGVLASRAGAITVEPGAIFSPSLSWTSVTFASRQTFSSIDVDATGVTFDSVRLGVQKFPLGLPRVSVTIVVWSPLQTVVDASVLRFTGDAVAGSTLYFGLSGIIPAREYVLQVDGAEVGRRFSDAGRNVSFVWSTWSIHDFHVLLGPRFGLPGPNPLTADFTYSPPNPVVAQTVSFSASVAGGTPPYTVTWDFADGGTGAGLATTHAFAAPRAYDVTLFVTDSDGQSRTAARTVTVVAAPPAPTPLVADFVTSPPNPRVGERVAFSATASGGTPPYAFAWDFADGAADSGMFANHTYATAGPYTVILTTSDAATGVYVVSKRITVLPAPRIGNVTAAFDIEINERTVTFVDQTVSDVGVPIVTWFWAFGDGAWSEESQPTHVYEVPGPWASFRVDLLVFDADGNFGSASRDVTLVNWPLLLVIVGLTAVAAAIPILFFLIRRRRRKDRASR